MLTRTICCKLSTPPEANAALKETSLLFAKACNHVLKIALSEKIDKALKLHKLCYGTIRKDYGLSANLAVRAIHRTTASLTRLKGKRKKPKKFLPKSIDYDARIFSYFVEKEVVSLTTTRGRLRLSLILGEHQRKALQGQNPTAATLINKGGIWYLHIVVYYEATPASGNEMMGIDLGITAATSSGLCIEVKTRRAFKEKRTKIRASLQTKNTRGARRVLRRLSGYENRRIRHENHVLSKHLVEEAKRHECGTIRMEQLKEIRRKTKRWNKHRNRIMAGWSFYQLQQFITYKAAASGITIELINPAYTSQTCHHCLKLGSRHGELFTCLTCGNQHADVNASRVIALGGAVVNQPELAAIS